MCDGTIQVFVQYQTICGNCGGRQQNAGAHAARAKAAIFIEIDAPRKIPLRQTPIVSAWYRAHVSKTAKPIAGPTIRITALRLE